jgi:uncharacterized protein YndB with AHSA1/START domain
MQIESEISIARPASAVFGYIAHGEDLPKYVTDFESVSQDSEGEPGVGTSYSYKMKRGVQGTFEWTDFSPSSRLAWHGPAVKSGPGSMEPSGWWELTERDGVTDVKLVMAPKPGGLFKLLSPFMSAGMRKGNAQALERLKQQLESQVGEPGATSGPNAPGEPAPRASSEPSEPGPGAEPAS